MAPEQSRPLEEPDLNDIVVQAQGLSKRFGSKWAVNALDLEVRRGELFGFLGPNGAGKSTTLFMMAGLARPTRGSVRLFGRPPSDLRGARSRLGALIEAPAFVPYLTARKNLELLGRLNGLRRREPIDEALERVGLAEAADQKVGSFSQGMRQRLGVAQAIQHSPELLILDEPTNGLDPEGGVEIWRLLREITASGRATAIVSSHLLHEIEEHCQRVCVLDRGRAVAQGAVADLLADQRPAVSLVFPSPEEAARARAWLERQDWAEVLPSPGGADGPTGIAVRLARAEAARLNRALHEAGLAPVYLSPLRRTLRDCFLELTSKT